MNSPIKSISLCWGAAALLALPAATAQESGKPDGLRRALIFHASFDGGADAAFASGDPKVYTVSNAVRRDDPKPGVHVEGVEIARGQGKYGDALRYTRKVKPVLLYRAEKNVAYESRRFAGTTSFWMSLDPEEDLEPGYCDPIQLTDKKWNDSCFFVDFDKAGDPRLFRLGVFSDFKEWNPEGRKNVPEAERPLVVVKRHPFGKGKWTHVAFTWEGFNTGREEGVAKLYLNGELQGAFKGKRTYTWNLSRAAIILGINYIGLFDDLAVFNRALTAGEIRAVGKLDGGVKSLGK